VTLPTFLGIGVPRAGTTWLHTLLSSHPQAYLPTRRKEVRFFDRHFDEGVAWYEDFFSPREALEGCSAIGEISPQYLYGAGCAERIASLIPDAKLLLMVRHPVDRAYSQYGFVVQRRKYRGSFEAFLETRPRALEMGYYSAYLKSYLRSFERSQILVLVFESAVGGGGTAREELAEFLGLPVEGFPAEVERVNASTVPRFPSLSNFAVSTGRRLRRRHLETIVDFGGRIGVRRLMTSGKRVPRLDPAVREQLTSRYRGEFDALEDLLGLDLRAWREPSSVRGTR
jgi:hypothetical protein